MKALTTKRQEIDGRAYFTSIIQVPEILYDHLLTRRAAPVDYDALSPEAQLELAEYAERYKGNALGLGRIDPLTGLWRPLLPKRT